MRARVFIGSSKESIKVARAVQQNLENISNNYDGSENTVSIESTIWDQGIFELSSYTLDSLVDALVKFDFGVFVFGPDDVAKIRGKELFVTRDNVVLELGLFIGKLGKKRNFLIVPRGTVGIHIPTDLLGLATATYDPNRITENLRAALQPACNDILDAIDRMTISGLATSGDTPKIPKDKYGVKIESPYANEQVGEECEVSGTYLTRPPEGALRVFVLSLNERLIWPQDFVPELIDGTWRGKAWFGDPTYRAIVAAVIVGEASQGWLRYYFKIGNTLQWTPLDAPMPPDIVVCDKVIVKRV